MRLEHPYDNCPAAKHAMQRCGSLHSFEDWCCLADKGLADKGCA
jgi:hypothetical protein